MNSIVLVSGGTGVGTSAYSFGIANKLDITSVIGTDWIRQVLRSALAPDINPTLSKSTYMAGQTENYKQKGDEVRKAEIIRAYKIQCSSVNVGVEGIIKRATEENIPLIIEGVHLRPGWLIDTDTYKSARDRIIELIVHIDDPLIHKDRFLRRQETAPARKLQKYIDNFQEIRWIHDYLVERAGRYSDIIQIENSGPIEKGLDKIMENLYSKMC